MSARDGLVRLLELWGDEMVLPWDPDTGHATTPAAMADKYLAAHAHELAEKIREETTRLKADGILGPDRFRPCRDAADQIDPEMTDSGA